MKKKIIIIDTSCGNLLSIKRAFEKSEAEVSITNDPKKILSAARLVLPGVGAFKNCIENLKKNNFFDILPELLEKRIPILGICLGMQILFDESEEFGINKGLGVISGKIKKLPKSSLNNTRIKVPSIGWYNLNICKDLLNEENNIKILKNLDPKENFYFVHSFHATQVNKNNVLATYNYGEHKIVSIAVKKNIIGCQFHPEKSRKNGLSLIKNFLTL